jgi:hypothetical protein
VQHEHATEAAQATRDSHSCTRDTSTHIGSLPAYNRSVVSEEDALSVALSARPLQIATEHEEVVYPQLQVAGATVRVLAVVPHLHAPRRHTRRNAPTQ